MLATLLVVLAWALLHLDRAASSTIWPMFGIANQLLAAVALAIATTILVNTGKARYAWVTLVPLAFVATTTLTAGFLSVRDNFWPMTSSPARHALQGFTNSTLTVIMLVCVATILVAAGRRWLQARNGVVLPAVASDEA